MEKNPVELTCEVSKPNAKAKWVKNGKEITPSDRVLITCQDTVHSLKIPESVLEDAATYKCILENKETSAKITVKGTRLSSLQTYPRIQH